MITITEGNLLQANAEALVNTVNCVGYMGKGIALQFKQAFPANFREYEAACKAGEVQPGRMLIHDNGRMALPHYLINFPTKRHWRAKSQLEDIRAGLQALVADVRRLGIRSIAVPPLGCGLGGLDWAEVRPLIEEAFAALPEVQVQLFAPKGSPDAKSMPVRTARPKMTPARALFIQLMAAYASLGYGRTLLEVQKLAYFLQEAGQPLRLNYQVGHYGPFAHNLNKVLEVIEGHYIRGYGDSQKPDTEIELLPGAVDEAAEFLADAPDSNARLKRVAELMQGFETPYGVELLATVHWVAHRPSPGRTEPARDADAAIKAVHAWNPRKKQVFQAPHVRAAWQRLHSAGWIEGERAQPASVSVARAG